MRLTLTLLLISTLFVSLDTFGQNKFDVRETKDSRVKKTYGFLLGQEYSLAKIKAKYPDLSINVTLAETKFNAVFNLKEKIRVYLISRMSDSLFTVYFDTVLFTAKKIFDQIELTRELAISIIEDIYKRANGNIPSPILETLLSFKFDDQPEKEFIEGYTQIFRTKGHSKSEGTDWQIKIPRSWKAKEGERPHIIQKFIRDNGDGLETIMLMINTIPLPKGHNVTNEDINMLFSEKVIKDMVPEDGKFISFTKMTFDGNRGGLLEMEQIGERLDLKFKIRMLQFMFVRDNKMYIVLGQVLTDNLDKDLSSDIQKYLPLYKLVANSIVVNDQYK